MVAEISAARSLLELPEECLVQILQNLPTRDVVAAQAISKYFRQLAVLKDVWESRLARDFGLHISVQISTFAT